MRQQRDPRRHAEAAHLLGGEQRDLGDLGRIRILIDVGVAEEQLPLRQDQHLHGGEHARPRAQPDDAADVLQMAMVVADRAAEHRIGIAPMHQHRTNQCGAAAHLFLRQRLGHALSQVSR